MGVLFLVMAVCFVTTVIVAKVFVNPDKNKDVAAFILAIIVVSGVLGFITGFIWAILTASTFSMVVLGVLLIGMFSVAAFMTMKDEDGSFDSYGK